MLRPILAAAACAAGALGSAVAQAPFHGTTDLVPIYATVADASGRLLPDLTQAEFEIRDNGRRQEIALFFRDPQPITVVVMLDRSGSVMSHAEVVQRAAERFLEHLRPDDRARVGAFAQTIQMLPADFTGDRHELIQMLREGLQEDLLGPSPVWTAMDQAVQAVSRARTRRVVLVFSDGHDDPGVEQIRTPFEDMRHRVTANDVMVYAIAVPGSAASRRWTTQTGLRARAGGTSSRYKAPDVRLRRIAQDSGGGYVELDPAQDLTAAFARVADELHRQYLLAFKPARLDGKTHEIDVRVKRNGATVRARTSYLADPRR